MIPRTIDLNCDLGERAELIAAGVDRALLGFVTSANIACGGHAGDEGTIRQSARDALAAGVAIGAHPGYPDRANFGRTELALSIAEIESSLREQLEAFDELVRAEGGRVRHVKPHGALYHVAMTRPEVAAAVARAAVPWRKSIILVGQAGRSVLNVWRGMGFRVRGEAFADRRYEADGTLRARTLEGAVLHDSKDAAAQAVRIALGQGAIASDGSVVAINAGTICVHGDTPGAVELARCVRNALEGAGVGCRC